MLKRFISWKLPATIIVALLLMFFDMPGSTQKTLIPFTPDSISSQKIHLGLDLQGGSQLDYKIDLRKVAEADKKAIVDGVKDVIEKRVNGLGVAEPNIYISTIGDEQHITVELAETTALTQGDVDTYLGKTNAKGEAYNVDTLTDDEKKYVSLEKAKATVGKTIQLEFKEEKGTLDPREKETITQNATTALNKIKKGTDFSVVGQEEEQGFPGKVKYEKPDYMFEDAIPAKLKDTVTALKVGNVAKSLIETAGGYIVDESGKTTEQTGLAIVKLDDVKQEVQNAKEVSVSHILVAWKGTERADAAITRTEDEAYQRIKEVKSKLAGGADFSALASEYSDDTGSKNTGGKLDAPVTGSGTYVYDFEKTALALDKPGQISDIIKTQFGYHIIKANDIKADVTKPKYKYETITYSTVPDPWKETGLTGKQFVRADVQIDNFYQPYVTISFNDEGAKLFEEITGRNVNKRVAIFVGGNLISAPNVNEKISGGTAQITGQFTNDVAKNLARDLNTGAIPAPIVLTGEYTIGATLGQEALTKSVWAGILGIFLVMLFMVYNYKVSGLIANASLAIYAAILLFLIKAQLPLGIALFFALIVLIFLVVKILNSKDSGWEKLLSFMLSCFAFFFVTYLMKTGVVLTLAGIAGIILSVGMAVDANVLILERLKEELKEGKTFSSALDAAFTRSWSAIRDSNFTTLLSCVILFYFGSSVIKGFAFNLAAGVLISMFTAIVITKILMQKFIGKKITENPKLLGVYENKPHSIQFIKRSKTWFSFSGILLGISVLAMIIFGFNLGLDFKGGSLMEFKFKEPVVKTVLTDTLTNIEKEINEKPTITTEPADPLISMATLPAETKVTDTAITAAQSEKLDLTKINITQSGDMSYILKTKYLTSEIHSEIIAKMKEQFPGFIESRFTTIGPTIGASMLNKAMWAILFSVILMVIYLALAFRKTPKEVNPWRFGVCAMIAMVHDIVITTGIFIILGAIFGFEIDALFITAMLTVFGYSINDTIIIFDRMRENLIHSSSDKSLAEITDNSLNQTLRRSLNTSLTTLIAIVSVLFFGSTAIFPFALALTIGIAIGTYSSIFTAAPLVVLWTNWAKKRTTDRGQQQ